MREIEIKWNEQTNRGGEIGEFLSKKGKREKVKIKRTREKKREKERSKCRHNANI